MNKQDFYNTKWDVSKWTTEEKIKWQDKMFELGIRWFGKNKLPRYLDKDAYYVDSNGYITYSVDKDTYYYNHRNTEKYFSDVFPITKKDFEFTKWDASKWSDESKMDLQENLFKMDISWCASGKTEFLNKNNCNNKN